MPSPSWFPDESELAGAEHLNAGFVAGYDRKQGGVPDQAAAEDVEVLGAHGIGGDSTVIDLGAGTGRFAAAIAAHVGRVLAVDVSPVMLDALRERAAAHGNIEVVQAGSLTYEHRGDPADAIHCRNVLHQLPDFWKVLALDRMARMLRPGGILRLRDLVYDFAPADAEQAIEVWLDGAATDPGAGYTRDDFLQHIRSEYSTFSWLLAPMLEQTAFQIVDVSNRATYAAYTCIRR